MRIGRTSGACEAHRTQRHVCRLALLFSATPRQKTHHPLEDRILSPGPGAGFPDPVRCRAISSPSRPCRPLALCRDAPSAGTRKSSMSAVLYAVTAIPNVTFDVSDAHVLRNNAKASAGQANVGWVQLWRFDETRGVPLSDLRHATDEDNQDRPAGCGQRVNRRPSSCSVQEPGFLRWATRPASHSQPLACCDAKGTCWARQQSRIALKACATHHDASGDGGFRPERD